MCKIGNFSSVIKTIKRNWRCCGGDEECVCLRRKHTYPHPSPPMSACAAALCRASVNSAATEYLSASSSSCIFNFSFSDHKVLVLKENARAFENLLVFVL